MNLINKEDEQFNNSCEDDTTSESKSNDSDGETQKFNGHLKYVLCLRKTSNT